MGSLNQEAVKNVGSSSGASANEPNASEKSAAPENLVPLLHSAYTILNPDLLYTSPEAAAYLEQTGLKIPPNFLRMDDQAQSRIFNIAGRKIGVVFFGYSGRNTGRAPNPALLRKLIDNALEEGRRVASQVDILIGVSPWGIAAEQQFKEQAAGLYHLLLGGGQGIGFPYASENRSAYNETPLWVRPSIQGRSLNLIRLYQWPEAGLPFWQNGINFEATFEDLGPDRPEDPEMIRIIEQM